MISYWSWGNAWAKRTSIARRSTSRLLRVMMMMLISMCVLPDRPRLRTGSRPGSCGSRGGWAHCRGIQHLLEVLQRRDTPGYLNTIGGACFTHLAQSWEGFKNPQWKSRMTAKDPG